jgi:hypothetical protein
VFKDTPAVTQGSIEVSFIIGHRGANRLPLLLATLKSIAAQSDVSLECIVVEQASNMEIKEALPDWVQYIYTPLPHPEMPYCRAWAFNVGARAAQGQLLVLHDNDVCVPSHYGYELIRLHNGGYRALRLQRFVFYLDEPTTETVSQKYRIPETFRISSVKQNCEGHSIAVDRQTYFRIGGHDEAFVGWGGEDNEFFERCQTTKCYPYMYLPFVHLYHASQPGKWIHRGHMTAELLEARSPIPIAQRVAELAARNFGNPEKLDPPYMCRS